MSSGMVSLVLPSGRSRAAWEATRAAIADYLRLAGFEHEFIACSSDEFGPSLRRAVLDARGSVILILDPDLPYPTSTIGDAVAMIESGVTDIVFAVRSGGREPFLSFCLRHLLVPILPDRALQLKAFSSAAARLVLGETRLADSRCALEAAFLANKYGFRVEQLAVDGVPPELPRSYGRLAALGASLRIRWHERNNQYRPGRRCPVCFSTEVWSSAQLSGNIVRACSRCKCRFLARFVEDDDTHPVRRVLKAHAPALEVEESHSATARERTSLRRLAGLRPQLPARARILEVGVRDGSFATAASREYEYVGIDPASSVVRAARARELEVYCATLANFVNIGPAFDAVVLFHVLENMPDPHDSLARIKDLLKPGGLLLLTAFDTEGIVYLSTERKRMARNFRTHLILYSRSALIELLERSGFELISIGPDLEYRDRKFLRHQAGRSSLFAMLIQAGLSILPDPLLVGSGSMRIVARRRSGPTGNVRAIRSVEPTHAR
jgi:SAM-dependent methyltransferase